MEVKNEEGSDIVEILVDGDVDADDYHAAAEKVLAVIEKHGGIRVLKVVKKFNGIKFDIFKDKLIFDMFKHQKDIRCAAVASDEAWVEQITNFLAPAYPYPVKAFKLIEVEQAREWLKSIN